MATQTINLTKKFETPMLDCYTHESFTDAYAGKRYDFAGVKSITVYSSLTVENADYTRTGTARYGATTELGDEIQELSMAKDRGFSFSIDAGNAAEQMNIKKANERMQHQWKAVCTPEMDIYRLNAWATGKGLSSGKSVLTDTATLTKDNVLEAIMGANIAMNNKLVPKEGRVLFMGQTSSLLLKLADYVVGVSDAMNEKYIAKGEIGQIDGVSIVLVPDSYLPTGVNFILKNRDATVDPVKIKSYKIHHDPVGINGDLVEGRWMYDSFVLDNYCNGIFVHKNA